MLQLVNYESNPSSEEDNSNQQLRDSLTVKKKKMKLEIAPLVVPKEKDYVVKRLVDPRTKLLHYNPKVEELFSDEFGPENPFKTVQERSLRNSLSGFVEEAALDVYSFEEQRRTFEQFGYAYNPSMNAEIIGNLEKAEANQGKSVFDITLKRKHSRKREAAGDPSDVENFKGTWGKYEQEVLVSEPTQEEKALLESWIERYSTITYGGKTKENVEKSILHLKDVTDYQGNTFMDIPKGYGSTRLDDPTAIPDRCFLPKKHIHTWTGHTKGVSVIRLFPVSGHLLLSGGMDSKIKLWEYYGKRRCIRTYIGHTEAILDLAFNNEGTLFLSCSFDKYIKLWNTETGECVKQFSTGKVPRCVKFNPMPDKQHMFIAGCKDKKIVQWDINTGEVVQEYDRHLGAINSVTFTEEGTRFVSTSDDNSIRIWEWEIPVDFKYIAEPTQHSMPRCALHPQGKWMCMQSMDNQVYVFSANGRYKQHRKKRFCGHLSAGYACEVNFSPDGTYVISGDYGGNLVIWDWKSGRLFSKIDCHKQVTIGCVWHPHEPSQVVTCSWDGTIKLWD